MHLVKKCIVLNTFADTFFVKIFNIYFRLILNSDVSVCKVSCVQGHLVHGPSVPYTLCYIFTSLLYFRN